MDVSIQECIAAILEMNFMHYTYSGLETSRLGRRSIYPWCMLDCKDGKLFVICVEEDQWQRFVDLMGNPEWATLEIFEDRVVRGQNYDALMPFLQEFAAEWTVADLYKAGQDGAFVWPQSIPWLILMSSEHLKAREFFTEISHQVAGTLQYPGAPFKVDDVGYAVRLSAPQLGEHNNEVYAQIGLSQAEIDDLKQGGII